FGVAESRVWRFVELRLVCRDCASVKSCRFRRSLLMTEKDYFQVGAKLIGLYCLVLMLPVLLGVLSTIIVIAGNTSDPLGVQYIPLFASPILLVALGVYLLKSRAFAHRISFEGIVGMSNSKLPQYSPFGMNRWGFFVIGGLFPIFLTLLASFLFVINQRVPYAYIVTAATGLKTNFVPDLAMIIFGIFLL